MTAAASGVEERLLLVSGRSVLVRPAEPADARLVAALFEGLSLHSRSMRFGYARRGLSPEEAARMSAAPGPTGAGLLALAGAEAEVAVGLARYERAGTAPEAELAITVADAWQGTGVGTGLIERLLAVAAADGLDALWAVVRPDNLRMLTAFRTLGGEIHLTREADEVLVRLPTRPDEGLEEAGTARFARASVASLEPLFRPRSIAVVGASQDPSSPGGAVYRALLASGFPRPVYAVNRRGGTIEGRPAYAALGLLPDLPDLVVVAVPAEAVVAVARDAAGHGARALVVLSSGFAEDGPAGAALQAELLHVARTSGLRVLGPNCLGIAVTDPAAPFDATFAPAPPAPGPIAFASQSGGLGIGALAWCRARGLGLSAFVSLGNKADVSSNDLLAWWEADPRTRAILLYLEGFGNPRRFARLARRVVRTTPIVALKSGRRSAARRAAGSHTAALSAGEAPTEAMFDLAGIVRVETAEELFDVGRVLAQQPLPAGDRVAVIASAAGPAILAADACEAAGLRLPLPSPELRDALAACSPMVAGTSNPVDLGAGAGPDAFRAAGRALLEADAADALLVVYAPTRGADRDGVVAAVEALANERVPVVGCLLADDPGVTRAVRPVPWLEFPEGAARALAGAARAGAASRRPPDPAVALRDADPAAARAALHTVAPGEWLGPEAVDAMLAAYGLRVPRSRVVRSAVEAAAVQAELGAPVAVKLVSRTLTHKSDVGGVVLDRATPADAAAAYEGIEARLRSAGRSAEMDGALIQEMAAPGPDLLIGARLDPVFGPLVVGGIGGGEAELWGDRGLALAPVGPRAAEELWTRLRGARLLDGWRGEPGADRAALADAVIRVGRLVAEQPLLAELDLNPVRAPVGGVLLVLDARARRGPVA
jgi:acetate---CoA ligase (ADP-forming)